MSKKILQINNIYKKFSFNKKIDNLRKLKNFYISSKTNSSKTLSKDEFWAIKNVSFSLNKGESLGILGVNGAGKSTLLSLINGTILPDHGTIDIFDSKVSLMTALGSNLAMNLSGIENIESAIDMSSNLSKIEKKIKIDNIISFSELEEFIHQPVHTYSSGMRARLSFALGINIDAQILLIDEVLAVGDIFFKDKCYRELAILKEKGISLIVVSHNPHAIMISCERSLLLNKGELVTDENTINAINRYESSMFAINSSSRVSYSRNKNIKFYLRQKNKIKNNLDAIVPFDIVLTYKNKSKYNDLDITIIIKNMSFETSNVLFISSKNENIKVPSGPKIDLKIIINPNGLAPGKYSIEIKVRRGPLFVLDEIQSHVFNVISKKPFIHNLYYQPIKWQFFE